MSDVNMRNEAALRAHLAPFGQEHLVAHWQRLSADEQAQLAQQVAEIDFNTLAELVASENQGEDWTALAARAEPPPAIRLNQPHPQYTAQKARERGEQALREGKVGTLLVAGGQGTRLGFDHPKGMFPLGPVSGATLFQILIEKLLAVRARYGASIPLYLMTSPATDAETREFLADHDRFGLPEKDLFVFCQGTMPAVDAKTRQVLMESHCGLALSPDGHGGMLAALERTGGLADIERRGLEQLFYFQVDNPLVTMCQPEFLGYHILSGSEISTQVVTKQAPADRVGNVVVVDGKLRIIEYSDLPAEAGEHRAADGSLLLWAGNMAVHVFEVDFLRRMAGSATALPFHRANKKVACIDSAGKQVTPTEPNAVKFERFIFDLLPAAERGIVVEMDERTAFAPVKNEPGKPDSPDSVRERLVRLHTEWLAAAGVEVAPGVKVEISPLAALDSEEARTRFRGHPPIRQDAYLR